MLTSSKVPIIPFVPNADYHPLIQAKCRTFPLGSDQSDSEVKDTADEIHVKTMHADWGVFYR